MIIVVLLQRLSKLLRLFRSTGSALGDVRYIWASVRRIFSSLRRGPRPSTLDPTLPKTTEVHFLDEGAHISGMKGAVVCTSQVPPDIHIQAESPTRLSPISELPMHRRPASMVALSSSPHQHLHPHNLYPYGNLLPSASVPQNSGSRPYSRSEPSWSLPQFPSRASSPSRESISTHVGSTRRGNSRSSSPAPSTRTHFDQGFTTCISSPRRSKEILTPHSPRADDTNSDGPRSCYGMHPTLAIERYDRKIILPKKNDDYELVIAPKTLDFQLLGVPDGWTAFQHPEGALYFFHEAKKIYTDAYICDPAIFYLVQEFDNELRAHVEEHNIEIPAGSELVLDLQKDGNEPYNAYYFVDHTTRSLFWVHEHNVTWATSEVLGGPTLNHFYTELTRYYWYVSPHTPSMHWENYPHGHQLPPNALEELRGILIHGVTDQLTSPTSTILYSVDDLERMINITKNARALGDTPYTTCVIARFLHLFVHARFLHYYGQNGARLDRDSSIFGVDKQPRTYLMKFLAPLLFNAPMVHLRQLEKIWVDKVMCHHPWANFIEKLKSEWEEFILYATVVLNANVAFLAIQSVDVGLDARIPPQIISYISTISAIGTILVGLLLVRQYRVKPKETVEEAVKFLTSREHPTRGVETLAILYSLPYALLLWAMVTFLGAFSWMCFMTRDHVSVWIPAVAWAVVGFLIVWCIYSSWETGGEPVWDRLQRGIARIREQSWAMLSRVSPAYQIDVERPSMTGGV